VGFDHGGRLYPFDSGANHDGHTRAWHFVYLLRAFNSGELNKQGMQGLERIVAKIKSFFNRKKQ
jgi:hypothetical protein